MEFSSVSQGGHPHHPLRMTFRQGVNACFVLWSKNQALAPLYLLSLAVLETSLLGLGVEICSLADEDHGIHSSCWVAVGDQSEKQV